MGCANRRLVSMLVIATVSLVGGMAPAGASPSASHSSSAAGAYGIGSPVDGDRCAELNPTCHATSTISSDGEFNLDAGFQADLAVSDFGGYPPSQSSGFRTLYQATQYTLAELCQNIPIQPTITVDLDGLSSDFTSDSAGDEVADVSVYVSLGMYDPATNSVWTPEVGETLELVRIDGSTHLTITQSQARIEWQHAWANPALCSHTGDGSETVDAAVSVRYTMNRGRPVDNCVVHYVGTCFGYVGEPNLTPDDMRASGRVASITVS